MEFRRTSTRRWTYARHRTSARRQTLVGLIPDARRTPIAGLQTSSADYNPYNLLRRLRSLNFLRRLRATFLLQKWTLDPKLDGIKREIKDRSCPFAPPRPPPEIRQTTT
ncbi:hypothetical protein M5K25_019145 [Dendrobium thyrsiflorum]|uniref:Uncharacterized protein n=1 Tax=Dendrobium thyrsiflorum TaxID=117978 RepID=A0ABD0UE82_DENTH